jgi:hypothetical protein
VYNFWSDFLLCGRGHPHRLLCRCQRCRRARTFCSMRQYRVVYWLTCQVFDVFVADRLRSPVRTRRNLQLSVDAGYAVIGYTLALCGDTLLAKISTASSGPWTTVALRGTCVFAGTFASYFLRFIELSVCWPSPRSGGAGDN